MASLSSSPSFACTFHVNKSEIDSRRGRRQPRLISCKVAGSSTDQDHESRRNILIGLAGTATALAQGNNGNIAALAQPIVTPPLSKCHQTTIGDMKPLSCCPPDNHGTEPIPDFKPPPRTTPLKVRPAAHMVARDREYLQKYEEAVRRMKALPNDDPRNFMQQANIHCAYCDGAYDQEGVPLRVHGSWLFFPWHRLYLSFHERIMAKLIDDETFALPFWNWDVPAGMRMPDIYARAQSPLHDPKRNQAHLPPTMVDLNFGGTYDDESLTTAQIIDQNLKVMYRQVISGATTAELFLGVPYRRGETPDDKGAGTFENSPHNNVHDWSGDPTREHHDNMGIFALAARDPMFYAHHANIDRVWDVWRQQGGKRRDFDDNDWLEASFLFYDENAQLVRVKVKDSLDTKTLGYKYQEVDNPWLRTPPTPRAKTTSNHRDLLKSKKKTTDAATFPFTLSSSPVTTTIKRPKISRGKKEKDDEEEVLVVDVVEPKRHSFTKFDVYVNILEHRGVGPESSEFAGSFVDLSHKHDHYNDETKETTTKWRIGINELLEDLEAEDDESLLVTLVPRSGKVKIKGIRIEFSK